MYQLLSPLTQQRVEKQKQIQPDQLQGASDRITTVMMKKRTAPVVHAA
jgi:hypothetical protein